MKKWETYQFEVNGFQIQCQYSKEAIEHIFIPLLGELSKLQKEKGKRILVYLAAAPAVGKTTLSKFLEYLSKELDGMVQIQALGLDGFHYHSDYIKSHNAVVKGKEVPMVQVKGCPETYDLDKVKEKLSGLKNEDILFPVYDRNLHDVVEDAVKVTGDIVFVEGNWLLLKDEGWNELKDLCDYSILIQGKEEALKERLIERKMKGGSTMEEAVGFYERSDSANVKRVLNDSTTPDLELSMTKDGDYIKVAGHGRKGESI